MNQDPFHFVTAPPGVQPLPAPAAGHGRLHPGALAPWLREGARAAVGLPARWQGLSTHPAVPLVLVALGFLLTMLLQRLYLEGPARFHAAALLSGGLVAAVMAWAALLVRPPPAAGAPTGAQVFCLLAAQALTVQVAWGALFVALVHAAAPVGETGWGLLLLAAWAWTGLVQWSLLRQCAPGRGGAAALAVACLATCELLVMWVQPARFWWPDFGAARAGQAAGEPRMLRLDQATMEAQPRLLEAQLQAVAAGRRGVVELYAIAFAPHGEEDVFRREAALVDGVMRERFDADGRSVQLVNHPDTAGRWPWATPLNLQRSIAAMARKMDRDEDVLFIHLTSHGGRDGHLAASLPPMAVDALTPQQLKAWLDEAGIRWRVVSVSACYAGSWIAPLAGEGTLVMTAADAEHTSYGCGRRSPLTFFGRAVYAEQLRLHTRSFEAAHAAAREVIARREQEAGKPDGYSNPQISVGEAVRQPLAALQRRLEAPPPPGGGR